MSNLCPIKSKEGFFEHNHICPKKCLKYLPLLTIECLLPNKISEKSNEQILQNSCIFAF